MAPACSNEPDGGCYFGDICSFGSSYYGEVGERYCRTRGGEWVEECPTDNCEGACESENHRYAVWYYAPDKTAAEGKEKCAEDDGHWSSDCEWVMPENCCDDYD